MQSIKVLLITTSTNSVRTLLETSPLVELHTIDCNDNPDDAKSSLQYEVDKAKPDLIITYRCPIILPASVFSKASLGAYNIHPSLLPKYPGLNPWHEMFRNHEREGGVTLHRITEFVDAGDIIYQSHFEIEPSDTIFSAREKADKAAADLVHKLIISSNNQSNIK